MFKQRLLTTLILVPLVLFVLFCGNATVLSVIVVSLVMLLGWEWLQLVPIKGVIWQGLFLLMVLALMVPAFYWREAWLCVDLCAWGLILLAVFTYPASNVFWGRDICVAGLGLLLLPLLPSLMAALFAESHGRAMILYVLCLIWAADIGGYLFGKQWGRHHFIAAVSPGKTIEGALGGLLLALLVAVLAYVYFRPPVVSWFAIAIATALMSVLGDLFVSMLKRRCALKDTGTIFPGHGGALDRLDSLLAALPWFFFLYKTQSWQCLGFC
jgi:CDP-diglyceride synthetase